jgi:hypothetical protein
MRSLGRCSSLGALAEGEEPGSNILHLPENPNILVSAYRLAALLTVSVNRVPRRAGCCRKRSRQSGGGRCYTGPENPAARSAAMNRTWSLCPIRETSHIAV